MIYDFIGDIHGNAHKLKTLLRKLGYRLSDGIFCHPDDDRQAVFLGDFIDRGPEIRETLQIARDMVESKHALAVLGNHEYNAICFHVERHTEPGIWIRRRTDKNIHQYLETLYQFKDYRVELERYLSWFRSLPLWLDLGGVRAVHAAWHESSMEAIAGFPYEGRVLSDDLLHAGSVAGSAEYNALQNLIKGPEIELPNNATFTDGDGYVRSKMRVRWWLNGNRKTYGELTFRKNEEIADAYPKPSEVFELTGYDDAAPVFFGHYWFRADKPAVINRKIACLDYSVASGGFLTAYTWRGENDLTDGGFTVV